MPALATVVDRAGTGYGSGVGQPAPVHTMRPWIDGEMGVLAAT